MRGEGWASHLLQAHGAAAALQESFTPEELDTAFLLTPRGLVITPPSDPNNVSKDLPQKIDTDVLPPGPLSHGGARGIEHIATRIWRLAVWRHFFDILEGAPNNIRTKLLAHFGHGSVFAFL